MASENGWEPARVNASACDWIAVPGTENNNPRVTLQLLRGRSLVIMRAYAADFNAYIEPLVDDYCAAYTPTNSVATSNHLNATAMDLNWHLHAFRVDYAGFDPAKIARMRELLAFYNFEGVQIIFWAQDWRSPKDAMHHQMGYGTYQRPDLLDRFIAQRIRSDGFSTYRRAPGPPPPVVSGKDAVALLIINESKRRNHAPHETIAELATGIQESQLNPEAVDSTGHKGVYQQDGGYPERHTVQGQIKGFFDRLDVKRASPGASQDIWLNIFWLQQRPSEPSADSAYANGRKGYLTEIKSRIPAATDYYNRLASVTPPQGGFLDMLNDAEQRELLDRTRQLWGALFNENASTSRYGDPDVKWPNHMYIRNTDGHIFDLIVEHNAALGDSWSLNQIRKKAAAGDKIAQAFLHRLDTPVREPSVSGVRNNVPAPTPVREAVSEIADDSPLPYEEPPLHMASHALEPVSDHLETAPVSSFSGAVTQYSEMQQQANARFNENLEQLRALLSRIIG